MRIEIPIQWCPIYESQADYEKRVDQITDLLYSLYRQKQFEACQKQIKEKSKPDPGKGADS